MKKQLTSTFLFFIICILSVHSVFGQKHSTLQQFVENIEKSPSQYRQKKRNAIYIQEPFFNKALSNIEISYSPTGDISIKNNFEKKDSLYTFHLVKTLGEYKGLALKNNEAYGYEIKSTKNQQIQLIKKPTEELFFQCSFSHNHEHPHHERKFPNYIGNSKTTTSVTELESQPGATNLIYLDFDGESNLEGWNKNYNTSAYTDEAILKTWEYVAEDFIPFDVNVTTNRSLFDAHPTANKGWAFFADFIGNTWGGEAHLNSFGTGKAVLIDAGPNGSTTPFVLIASSHELGHAFGLRHDGKSGVSPYYAGHGEFSPIMGNGSNSVSHWSNGSYFGATNTEDDLMIISSYLGSRSDDKTNTEPLFVLVNDSVLPTLNNGMIENNLDLDTFSFELASTGNIDLTVQSSIQNTDLDVLVKLYSENGALIGSYNPISQRKVSFSKSLNAGKYYFTIEGDGELTPNDGFTDYSSFGYYEISGKIENSQKYQNDIVLLKSEKNDNICDKQYTPKISVLNNGTGTINSFNVEVRIDGTLDHTETIQASLSSGQSTSFTLNPIEQYGTHTISFTLVLPNNEVKTYNNTNERPYTLKDGVNIAFSINLASYSGTTPVSWNIKDASNQLVTSSSNLKASSNGTISTQSYCIATGCFDFDIQGNFNLCTGAKYNPSSTYTGGSKVYHQGTIYEAKWWVAAGATPPSSEWQPIGTCNEGPIEYKIINMNNNLPLVEGSSDNFNGSSSKNFCLQETITSTNHSQNTNTLSIHPNPASGIVHVNLDYEKIELLSFTGTKINTYSKNSTIDISSITPGVYLVRLFQGSGKVFTEKLIIK